MTVWLILLGVAVLLGGFLAFRAGQRDTARRLTARRAPAELSEAPGAAGSTPLLGRTVADLRVDDVVQHRGRDWLVEGLVEYEEDGHPWRGARIVDGGEVRWLIVNLDRGSGLNLRLLEAVAGLELPGYPPESLVVSDAPYTLAKRGTANAVPKGDVGELPGAQGLAPGSALRCRWWRYAGAGDKVVLVEEWGDKKRVLAGASLPPDDVDLLAAT